MPDLDLIAASDQDVIRYTRLGNRTARYMVTGNGPPLLLLHGCPGSIFSWRSNIDEFSQHHRVYALDLMGFGGSQSPGDSNFSLAAHAQFVRRFLVEIGLKDLCVVAHSMGAGIALHVAALLPERISRLVLIGCLGLEPHLVLKLVRFPGVVNTLLTMTRFLPTWIQERFSSTFYHILYNELAPLASGDVVRERVELTGVNLLGSTLRTAEQADCDQLKAICQLIAAPTLMIHGKRDRLVPWKRAVQLSRELRASVLHLVDEAGHMLHVEQAQDINQQILDFTVPKELPIKTPRALRPPTDSLTWVLPPDLVAQWPPQTASSDAAPPL